MRRVVAVTFPFLKIPGIAEQVFSAAQIHYLSLVPMSQSLSPTLSPVSPTMNSIPLQSLHTRLIKDYWSTTKTWQSWQFLEDEFDVLRNAGFVFSDGDIDRYTNAVASAASQFLPFTISEIKKVRADAISVYGRGHWTMNVTALAAETLGLPLFVIERGILPNSYIVDLTLPYTAVGSTFRNSWESFRAISDGGVPIKRRLTESRWLLHYRRSNFAPGSPAPVPKANIIIGQCMFDYNCLHAPFKTPTGLIESVFQHHPRLLDDPGEVCYKPHPLSPEEYRDNTVVTRFGSVPVDYSPPWEGWTRDTKVFTWNSTLGLEARLLFETDIAILDPHCHYSWVKDGLADYKTLYIAFLNGYSLLQ